MGRIRRLRGRPRPQWAARGATVVEYALVVSLFVLATVGSAEGLACVMAGKARKVEQGVAVREPILPDHSVTTTTTFSPPTSSPPPASSTTSSTTNTSSTTTTEAPTTTTTEAPATTTTAPAAPKFPDGALTAAASSRGSWWDGWGGRGEWVASTTLSLSYPQMVYADIEVTKTLANGSTVTERHYRFFVPANGSATLDVWTNPYGRVPAPTDVVSVTFRVTSVLTYDEGWNEVSFVTDGPTSTAHAPAPPS